MNNWRYTYYQQRGIRHRVCQDCVRVYSDNQRIIACLCDGLGSLNNSDLAAQVAVKSVIEILGEYNPFRCSDVTADNLTHLKKKLISEVQRRIAAAAKEKGFSLASLDCTLLFVCMFPQYNTVLTGNLGDSALCIIRDNRSPEILCDSTFVGTRAVMDKDAAEQIHCKVFPLDEHVKSILLTSDGLENEIFFKGLDFLGKETEIYLNAMLSDRPKEIIQNRIRLLTSDRDTIFDDDISIAVISCLNQPVVLEDEPTWPCVCGNENPLYETFCTNCSRDFLDLYRNIDFKGKKTEFFRRLQRNPAEKKALTDAMHGGSARAYENPFASKPRPSAQNASFAQPGVRQPGGGKVPPAANAPAPPGAPQSFQPRFAEQEKYPGSSFNTPVRQPEPELRPVQGVSPEGGRSGISTPIAVILVVAALIVGMLISGVVVMLLKDRQIKGLEEQLSQALEYTIVTEAEEATADSSAKATADEHGENSSNAESGESQHDHSSADAQEFADEIIAD